MNEKKIVLTMAVLFRFIFACRSILIEKTKIS